MNPLLFFSFITIGLIRGGMRRFWYMLVSKIIVEQANEADDEAAQVIKEESSDIYKKINKDITWSKVDKETYNCYQQMVRLLAEREKLIPIEYDFVKWGTSKAK